MRSGAGNAIKGRIGNVLSYAAIHCDARVAPDLHELHSRLVLGGQIASESIRALIHVLIRIEDWCADELRHGCSSRGLK